MAALQSWGPGQSRAPPMEACAPAIPRRRPLLNDSPDGTRTRGHTTERGQRPDRGAGCPTAGSPHPRPPSTPRASRAYPLKAGRCLQSWELEQTNSPQMKSPEDSEAPRGQPHAQSQSLGGGEGRVTHPALPRAREGADAQPRHFQEDPGRGRPSRPCSALTDEPLLFRAGVLPPCQSSGLSCRPRRPDPSSQSSSKRKPTGATSSWSLPGACLSAPSRSPEPVRASLSASTLPRISRVKE